jgi:hypothetical protein
MTVDVIKQFVTELTSGSAIGSVVTVRQRKLLLAAIALDFPYNLTARSPW